jgi:hypothetical protein
VPAAIIGVADLTVLEPATWRRWWWGLYVTGAAITCQGSSDQTTQNTGCNAAGDDPTVVVVSAGWITIGWWRRTATVVAIWTVIILCRCSLNAG